MQDESENCAMYIGRDIIMLDDIEDARHKASQELLHLQWDFEHGNLPSATYEKKATYLENIVNKLDEVLHAYDS